MIVESVCFVSYVLSLSSKAANSSAISSCIRAMPWLPYLPHNNCWCWVDSHFYDGVMHMSCTVSDKQAARTSYMNYCHNMTHILAKMHYQKLLILYWYSLPGWGREHVDIVFAHIGGWYLIYGCLQPIASQITQDTWPKIVDALLTLICRMGQRVYCCYCCGSREPIPHLWMAATIRHLGYPRCNGKHHWHSVDTWLTLIFKMVQWLCCLLFYIYRPQIH